MSEPAPTKQRSISGGQILLTVVSLFAVSAILLGFLSAFAPEHIGTAAILVGAAVLAIPNLLTLLQGAISAGKADVAAVKADVAANKADVAAVASVETQVRLKEIDRKVDGQLTAIRDELALVMKRASYLEGMEEGRLGAIAEATQQQTLAVPPGPVKVEVVNAPLPVAVVPETKENTNA